MGVYHLKDTTKQQDVFMMLSKRVLKFLNVFRHSVEKPHDTYNTQLEFECSFYWKLLEK